MVVFWALWVYILLKVPPLSNLALMIFFATLFAALFLSVALISANSRRGLLFALFIVLLLIMQYFQIANILNIGLLTGIFLSLEFYFSRQNS